ncbi:MAG: SDR family oxidoreductase [Rhodobacteraceae bacterium]|nr:SDR family oxidoreductase [Paracoccaceae bacterium]
MIDALSQTKVAVVTGAGSGLGRALAVGLTGQGMTVVGFGRRLAELEVTQTLCADSRFMPMAVNVEDVDAVDQAFAHIETAIGPVTLLINNAAVYPRRDFLEETAASFMRTVTTNLGGTVACSRAALRGMVARGQGRILNVATFADIAPVPTASAYSVSKGAARILTRAMVADLGDRFPGIVINDWMPGMLQTRMGISDGLPPEVAAAWGVRLALMTDPSLNGSVFEKDCELLPGRGLKRKIKDLLLLRKRAKPRRL